MHGQSQETGNKSRQVAIPILAISATVIALQGCGDRIANLLGDRDGNDGCRPYYATIAAAKESEIQGLQEAAFLGEAQLPPIRPTTEDDGSDMNSSRLEEAAEELVGLSATYYLQKVNEYADRQAILASINSDAANERAIVARTGKASASIRNCRLEQVANLSKQMGTRSADASQATAQLRTINDLVPLDNEVISEAFNSMSLRVFAYIDAVETIANADREIALPSAEAATPHVALVETERANAISADTARRLHLAREIKKLESLLR